jgi:hypothetical protein
MPPQFSVQPFDKREAVSMNAFALKYGNQSITLAQSKQLIGVKLRQNDTDDAQAAVQRTLPESSWKSEGILGGFRLVSICNCALDADQALDQIRRDESVLVGTHVFELSEGRGIFVPTGELFVGFKLGTSAELKEKVIREFGLKIKDSRGREGFFVAVTPQSPNPIKVAMNLQQRPFVSIAQPDLASKGVIKVLRLSSDGLSAAQWHRRSIGFQRNPRIEFLGGAEQKISEVVSRHMAALAERSVTPRWHFTKVRREPALLPKPKLVTKFDRLMNANEPQQAGRDDDSMRRTPAPIVASVMTAPTANTTSTAGRSMGRDDPPPAGGTTPMIEIVMGAATIRVPPGADLPTLQAVLHAVRSLP